VAAVTTTTERINDLREILRRAHLQLAEARAITQTFLEACARTPNEELASALGSALTMADGVERNLRWMDDVIDEMAGRGEAAAR
jgi:hypothetical protein